MYKERGSAVMIDVRCPTCGAHLEFPAVDRSARLLCTLCKRTFSLAESRPAAHDEGVYIPVNPDSPPKSRLRRFLSAFHI